MKIYYVYILTNKHKTVLSTGITGNLIERIAQHKNKTGSKFASKYNTDRLVYYEEYGIVEEALAREKEIKGN